MGLIVLAEPIARLLFERGQFLPQDTIRTARMIAVYATGVWAYCASPVLVRGFYALNDRVTPVRIAVWVVGLNLVLNLTLIWPLAEVGLAVSNSAAAAVQAIALVAIFSRRGDCPDFRGHRGEAVVGENGTVPFGPRLASTVAHVGRTLAATALMAAAVMLSPCRTCPPASGCMSQVIRVGVPLALGASAYCGSYWLLGGRELSMLIGRQGAEEPEDVER